MSGAVTVRNVPDWVRNEIAARAARSGRSMQEFLLAELTALADRPSQEEMILRIRARARTTGLVLDTDTIIADRDAGRR